MLESSSTNLSSVTDPGLKAVRNHDPQADTPLASVTDPGLKAVRNCGTGCDPGIGSVTDPGLKAVRNSIEMGSRREVSVTDPGRADALKSGRNVGFASIFWQNRRCEPGRIGLRRGSSPGTARSCLQRNAILLSGRMCGAVGPRPAGVAFDLPGKSTKLRFSTLSQRYTTLSPRCFIVADVSAVDPSSLAKVGWAGFALDTERGSEVTHFPPIWPTSQTGDVTLLGPYNIRPARGCGCKYRLGQGGMLRLRGVRNVVFSDELTQSVCLPDDITWNLDN